ncbi:hypothetical protein MTO96_023859 [Rhipicephalus appendiculatus]
MLRVVARWSVLRRPVVTAARQSMARCLATDRSPGMLLRVPPLLTVRTFPYLQPVRSKSKKVKSKATQSTCVMQCPFVTSGMRHRHAWVPTDAVANCCRVVSTCLRPLNASLSNYQLLVKQVDFAAHEQGAERRGGFSLPEVIA